MAKKPRKKGLFGKAIDAVSTRDEKAAAEKATREAQEAAREAMRESAARRTAEARLTQAQARADQVEGKLDDAEERVKAAEQEALEAKLKLARLERERKLAEAKAASLAASEEIRRKAMEEAKAKAEAKAEAEAEARTYTVQAGDTLSRIAGKLLGDATRWKEIWEANKDQIKDPNLIHVGQELRIP